MTFKKFQEVRAQAYQEMLDKEKERLSFVYDLSHPEDRRELLLNPWILFRAHMDHIVNNLLDTEDKGD